MAICLVFILAVTISLNAQSKRETYIIEMDTLINLKNFELSDGYLNSSDLINYNKVNANNRNKKLTEIAEFLEDIKPITVRRFIRRLPEDVKFLKTATGLKFNVEGYQKLLVVET
jgi:hypothetical protein